MLSQHKNIPTFSDNELLVPFSSTVQEAWLLNDEQHHFHAINTICLKPEIRPMLDIYTSPFNRQDRSVLFPSWVEGGRGVEYVLHCLGFKAVAKTPKMIATTVKPWAKMRPLISSWDCLVFPWWKARSPYISAPAVPKQPGWQKRQLSNSWHASWYQVK